MKLSELAARTRTSTATLKFWIREGILPPGELRNQTTAVYGEGHVERIALVRTLREEFDLPIARIRALVVRIDDPGVSLLEIMEECQLIATGLRAGDAGQDARVPRLLADVGWPDATSVARDALSAALRDAEAVGVTFGRETLARYARMLAEFAREDIASIRTDGTRDAVARALLQGAAAQTRVLVALNQLAHTSAAISDALARAQAAGAAPGAGLGEADPAGRAD